MARNSEPAILTFKRPNHALIIEVFFARRCSAKTHRIGVWLKVHDVRKRCRSRAGLSGCVLQLAVMAALYPLHVRNCTTPCAKAIGNGRYRRTIRVREVLMNDRGG